MPSPDDIDLVRRDGAPLVDDAATMESLRLAPGESAEVGKTPERTYYVYAHELGDPECTLGCWSGKVEYELQGELWPFMEKTMKGAKPGDTVNHKFSC